MTGDATRFRICQMGPVPPPHGGVATNMLAIHERLVNLGHQSTIIDVTDRRAISRSPDVLKPHSALDLLKTILTLDCDLIHYHIGGDMSSKLALLTLFCGVVPGKRSVVTFHSGGYARSAAEDATASSLQGIAFRSIDRVIGVSEEIVQMFRSFGVSSERIRMIGPFEPKFPDPSISIPADLAAFAASSDPFLVAVGALETEYRNDFLIEAMPAVIERYPAAGLMIIGTGSLENELSESVKQREMSNRVRLVGGLDHGLVLHLIRRADVLLRMTEYDGDSVAVREALDLGTQVIASDNAFRPPGVIILQGPLRIEKFLTTLIKAGETQFLVRSNGNGEISNVGEVLAVYRELLGQG